jgi:acetyltransferase-like isoleucine patch superfamily enzyme
MISAHVFEGKTLLIRRVEIADNVIIGARTVIGPGVRMGERAVVMPNSVVAVFSQIGAGELWGGNPAEKVQEGHAPGSYPKVSDQPSPARSVS